VAAVAEVAPASALLLATVGMPPVAEVAPASALLLATAAMPPVAEVAPASALPLATAAMAPAATARMLFESTERWLWWPCLVHGWIPVRERAEGVYETADDSVLPRLTFGTFADPLFNGWLPASSIGELRAVHVASLHPGAPFRRECTVASFTRSSVHSAQMA
jgi:hypothetical protein